MMKRARAKGARDGPSRTPRGINHRIADASLPARADRREYLFRLAASMLHEGITASRGEAQPPARARQRYSTVTCCHNVLVAPGHLIRISPRARGCWRCGRSRGNARPLCRLPPSLRDGPLLITEHDSCWIVGARSARKKAERRNISGSPPRVGKHALSQND